MQVGPFQIDQALITEYNLIDVETEEEALNWVRSLPVPSICDEYNIELRRLRDALDFVREPIVHSMEVDLQDQLSILKKYESRIG